jgi:hypothetical protein
MNADGMIHENFLGGYEISDECLSPVFAGTDRGFDIDIHICN